MTTVAAIIQARMGSTRLPGKVLEDLAGQTVLAHVIARAQRIPGVHQVGCAIPAEERSDPVAAEAKRRGALVHRGSEDDVLGRYCGAAMTCKADVVMRITSDCPLIDPEVSGQVLKHFFESGADYCSNVDPRSWPKGLDTEVFSAALLERAAQSTQDPHDREHVTPWMRKGATVKKANVGCSEGNYASYRWTLDYPQDLVFFRQLYRYLPSPPAIARFSQILAVVHDHPEIVALNSHLQ